jgi:hypothetical protein
LETNKTVILFLNLTRFSFYLTQKSIDKVNRIGSLVLVIHGTDDEVIDISHGVAIHEKCKMPVDPLYVEGAGHNDVEIYSQYVDRLKRFINEEIRHHQYSLINAQQQQQQQNVNSSNTVSSSASPPSVVVNTASVQLSQPAPSTPVQQKGLDSSLTELPALLRNQQNNNDK